MQFEQVGPGDRRPLPKPSVDTGMGLERLCAVLNGVRSNYETDLLRPLIAHAEKLSGKTFDPTDYAGTSVSLRAIADHARAAAFLIADGVFPDKTGREYVLRRIMRRGIYHGWLLGIKAAVPARDRRRRRSRRWAASTRELRERASLISKACLDEETRFRETLERGVRILDRGDGERARARPSRGELAFKLYDTYGFPLDLTRVIAEEHALDASTRPGSSARWTSSASAASSRARARSRSRACSRRSPSASARPSSSATRRPTGKSKIVALVADGKEVDEVGPFSKNVAVVTAETPFYGEQGGQMGDTGTLASRQRREDDRARRASARCRRCGFTSAR